MINNKRIYLLYFSILFFIICIQDFTISQNAQIDSLKNAIRICKEDTNKLNLLYELSRIQSLDQRFSEGLKTAKMTEALAKKMNSKKWIAKAYHCIGNAYIEEGNYPQALNYHLRSLKIKEELGDIQGQAYSYNNLGKIYRIAENYKEAINNYSKSIQLKKELVEKAKSLNNTAEVKRLSISIATTSDNIGTAFEAINQFEKALNCYNETQKIYSKYNVIERITNCLQNKGVIYFKLNKYNKALEHFLEVLELCKDEKDSPFLAGVYLNIGTTYLELKDTKKSRMFLEQSLKLAQFHRLTDVVRDNFGGLFELEKLLGNKKQTFLYYKQYIKYRDSISNKLMLKKMKTLQLTYDYEKIEKQEKLIQEKKDAVSQEKNSFQKIIILSICLVIIIVVGFAIYAWINFKQKQKINIEITKQKEMIEEKQKEILSSIIYAKRIQTSLLTSENYIEKALDRLSNK